MSIIYDPVLHKLRQGDSGSGSSSPIKGSVDTYADLAGLSASDGDIYYVKQGSGGYLAIVGYYKYPKGFYIYDGSSWTQCKIQSQISEDAMSLVNIDNWDEFVSTGATVNVNDRVVYNGELYKNLTGNIGTAPDGDSTNWTNINNYWQRVGTELSPVNDGDNISTTGCLGIGRSPSSDYMGDFYKEGDHSVVNIETSGYNSSYVRFANTGGAWGVGQPSGGNRFAIVSQINRRVIEMYSNAIHNSLFINTYGTVINGANLDCDFTINKLTAGTAFKYDAGDDLIQTDSPFISNDRFATKSGVKEKLEGIDASGNVADNMHYIVINTENNDVDLSFDDVDDVDNDGQVWIITARNNTVNKATLTATKGFYGAGLSGETEYEFSNQWDTIEIIYSDIIQGFIIR